MGYDTRVTGELTISPPLTYSEIQASGLDIPDPWGTESCVRLRVATQEVTTDRGVLLEKTAATLIPIMEDSFRAGTLVSDVQTFAAAFGGTHAISGVFDCSGDDGDLWRLEVEGGKVRKIRMAKLWPEDVAELRAAVKAERWNAGDVSSSTFRAAQALLYLLDNAFQRDDRR